MHGFFVADYDQNERSLLISQMSLERTFGTSSVFIESTLMENGGLPESTDPSTLIKEAIHVISCGYEQKTSWGREVHSFYSCSHVAISCFPSWLLYCIQLHLNFHLSANHY